MKPIILIAAILFLFPRISLAESERTPVASYGKRRTTNDYYVPVKPYSTRQVGRMRQTLQSSLGTRYGLRAYFRPGTPSERTWCSPFVGKALNASGLYSLNPQQVHEPQRIINTVSPSHVFSRRVLR